MFDQITAFQDEVSNFIPNNKSNISSSFTDRVNCARVRVPENTSAWIVRLKDQFDELTALPYGWDGYSGKPVSFASAQFAANLIERLFTPDIPPPQLVPGNDGSLQIEWHLNQIDVEIDIHKPYEIIAVYYNHRTKQEYELELQTDFTILSDWLTEIGHSQGEQVRGSQVASS